MSNTENAQRASGNDDDDTLSQVSSITSCIVSLSDDVEKMDIDEKPKRMPRLDLGRRSRRSSTSSSRIESIETPSYPASTDGTSDSAIAGLNYEEAESINSYSHRRFCVTPVFHSIAETNQDRAAFDWLATLHQKLEVNTHELQDVIQRLDDGQMSHYFRQVGHLNQMLSRVIDTMYTLPPIVAPNDSPPPPKLPRLDLGRRPSSSRVSSRSSSVSK